MKRAPLLLVVTLAVGCQTPMVEVRNGTTGDVPSRVVMLPPSCASLEDLCRDDHVVAVGQLIAGELSFAGFTVIDAEKLAVDARTKPGTQEELRAFGERVLRAGNRRQIGATFEDLSPAGRAQLLAEGKADGTVGVRLTISSGGAFSRVAEVMIRVGKGDDDTLSVVSRCGAETGMGDSLEDAFEAATSCALKGALTSTSGAESKAPAAPGPV